MNDMNKIAIQFIIEKLVDNINNLIDDNFICPDDIDDLEEINESIKSIGLNAKIYEP